MRFLLYLFSLLVLLASPALTQDGRSVPACSGEIVVVRVSTIKPGGSMKGFMDAVAAHQAWYRNNGNMDNEIVAARVIAKDDKTGKLAYSETDVLTYHLNPPAQMKGKAGDDAWNAYVKMYRDNSDLKSEYMTCMPKREKK